MSTTGFVVRHCTAPGCALRFPAPHDDDRLDDCPRCEAATQIVEPYPPPFEPAPPARPAGSVVAVLDNIRSALNVGTILRSADGAMIDEVRLCGITAEPESPKVRKTSLGAERSVGCSWSPDVEHTVADLIGTGYEIWALEASPTSVALSALEARPQRLAFVVGNEVAGVDPAVMRRSSKNVHIEMHGAKTSLNVGVAFGIAAFALQGLPVH